MKIEIFTLEYLRFIFSSTWVYIGFILILTVITGDLKRLFSKIKAFMTRVQLNYRAKLNKEAKLNKN
jgi:hypothetical protein